MEELISGKQALKALSKGKKVQVRDSRDDSWYNLVTTPYNTSEILAEKTVATKLLFRMKPETMMLNGYEIPSMFIPKKGDAYYYLCMSLMKGYGTSINNEHSIDEYRFKRGVWRTESDVKKVLEVLEKITEGVLCV